MCVNREQTNQQGDVFVSFIRRSKEQTLEIDRELTLKLGRSFWIDHDRMLKTAKQFGPTWTHSDGQGAQVYSLQ